MTPLTKPVRRVSAAIYQKRNIIVTFAPCGAQSEGLIHLRLKGRRHGYLARVSDVFNVMAEWHGYKERAAKREARKHGIPWATAKKKFHAANSI